MSTVIETKNLSKFYGKTSAVTNVSFSVNRGEVVGFVGLNGAGKSTTINMLLGFQQPSEGEVYLFDEKVTLPNAYKSHHRIGFATGDMSLFDGMTGAQYLRFVARMHGASIKTETFQRLVERFSPQLDKKLPSYHGGIDKKLPSLERSWSSRTS